MISVTNEDKVTVVDILVQAFIDNKSVNYIIQHKNNLRELRALMEYSFDTCLLFGQVLLSDERNACALILYPQRKKTSIKSIWLDINLILKAIGISRVKTALDRESKIKALQPKIPMSYVWFVAVNPKSQHCGLGTKLMREIIEEAEKQALPVILETSTIDNLPWYQQLGFEIYDKLDLSYTLYFLRR